ncbi:MAG: EAL domain-containing protein [Pseudomonadales bacterium]|nr:EAL domain-containing protein [Pseudomonadales bacterium]MBO6564683.1 EAL domain-containing protein [Pseudomonadales bacterium]MBO6596471.1 EAL domain-containing protein [Pseudomonadales bacterium]MBO6822951.1 EAL domain-containing protein [Pseudomonadales bacterium]
MNALTETQICNTVLIVDDEPGQLDSLNELMRLSGYQVNTASSGNEAIDLLEQNPYDTILLDLNMPNGSGYDVIDHVVNHNVHVKVIVVSGNTDFDSTRNALKKGAYDFLKKPYVPDELLATVKNATSKKQLELANQTIHQRLEESEHLHRFIVDHSPDIVFMLDKEGHFTFLNDTVYQTLGFDKSELLGEHYSKLVSNPSQDQAQYVFTERRSGQRKSNNVELKLKCKDDSEHRYFDTTSMSVELDNDNIHGKAVQGTYGVARDVTEKKQAQETINYQAYHDMLTRLPNRVLMEDRLDVAMTHATRNKERLAVMFLDLDRFKWVNDTLGHTTGDRLLQSVSQRLESCLRKGDTLARFGGDEFALILPSVNHEQDAAKIAEKVLEELREPFSVDEHELYVTSSIGIAMYPEAGRTIEALIASADLAMYSVKERGKNGFEFFDDEMNEASNARLTIERELRKALSTDDIKVCYQPQVNSVTEKLVGFEALIRWEHPANGLIYPGDFIPIAEETGLILDLGRYVLDRACADVARWRNEGMKDVRVSINFSGIQVEQDTFIDEIKGALQKHNLPGEALEVEITENVIMNDMSSVIKKLRELAGLNIKIAIDDFGTGYSSLSYLQQFPINTLKIDKSFISSMNETEEATSIVDAIVAMAKGLKLSLIAEGVETDPQLEYLKSLGCEAIQGYLFGKAEGSERTKEILARIENGEPIRNLAA